MKGKGLEYVSLRSKSEPQLWPGIAAGIPVLVFGLALILVTLQGSQSWLLFAAEGIVLTGIVIGWLGWFPNWAYAFAGMAVLFSLWWSLSSTGTDQPLSGPLAWSPLLVSLAVSGLLARSFKPFIKFFQGLLRDWSLASLALYGILPLAMYTAMSNMPADSAIVFQVLATLFMTTGAGMAGWVERPHARWRALLLGMSWTWIVVTLGVALYWHGRYWEPTGQVINWLDQVLGMSMIWVILAVIVFFPAGLALIGRLARKVVQNNQAGGTEKQ